MKMRKFGVLWFISFLVATSCLAQSGTTKTELTLAPKHSIGIQLNPYLHSPFFQEHKYPTVFAVRYGYQLKNNLRFGAEFSLWHQNDNYAKYNTCRFGLYTRYSFLRKWNVQPFVEANGFYFNEKGSMFYTEGPTSVNRHGFDYFLAPGLTLYCCQKHLSLDLMFKWNHKNGTLMNMGPFEFSYRLTYHFNKLKKK